MWGPQGSSPILFCWPFCTCTWCPEGSLPIFVPLFLFHSFCSVDLFELTFRVPVTQCARVPTNFYSTVFVLFTFLHLHLESPPPNVWGPHQLLFHYNLFAVSPPIFNLLFLFHCFCSAVFVPLTFLHLHLGSLSPNVRVPTNVYSTVFVHCFCSTVFVPLFLFHCFCSTDLFALPLRVPVTKCLRVPTNFYSTMTFLHCPQQFLFLCFCSTIYIPLTLLHLQLSGGSLSPSNTVHNAY